MNNRIYYSEEAAEHARRKQTAGAVMAMLIGMSVGAILALLYAPQEGSTTRHQINDTAEDYYENGRDSTKSALHRLQQEFNDFREQMEDRIRA